MGERLALSRKFKMLTPNVYFQPPASKQLKYPCIVYKLSDFYTVHADNTLYGRKPKYEVTAIDRDPDSPLPYQLIEYPLCSFDRHYTADNLHHWVFGIYY